LKNKYFPSHFIVFNGYLIHSWFNGKIGGAYQTPIYATNFFRCSYGNSRKEKFANSGITKIPTVFNHNDVLWLGSYLVGGTNRAQEMGKCIKRYFKPKFMFFKINH